MTRLPVKNLSDLSETEQALMQRVEGIMGFTPNDALTMARVPGLIEASFGLVQAVLNTGTLDPALKRLVGLATSFAAGCTYCQAHARYSADALGVPIEKVGAVLSGMYEKALTEGEAAAVQVAAGAGMSPSAVTDAEFDSLKQYFSDDECAEIVAIIALYGFLNRWNSTLKTDLEAAAASCPLPSDD